MPRDNEGSITTSPEMLSQKPSAILQRGSETPKGPSSDEPFGSERERLYFRLPFLPPPFLAGAFLAVAFLPAAFFGAFAFFGAAAFAAFLRLLPPT
jgi:hypothetical protein